METVKSPAKEHEQASESYRQAAMSPYREITMAAGVTAMNIEDASMRAGSIADNKKERTGLLAKLDEFRDFVGRTCCSCVSRMPAILLVLAICLAVVLLFALIPAIFILTNAVQSEPAQALVSTRSEEINVMRNLPGLVADNETEEDVPLVHGIPITALYPPNVSMSYGFGFACYKQPSFIISTSKRCDGFSDCPDGSDELGCHSCQSWASCELENNQLACLHGGHICDKVKHCRDGFDENEYCNRDCDEDQHKCKKLNGMDICLPRMAICDGHKDCADNSDEEQCSECAGGAKFCADKNICIPTQRVCDGIPDCDDYSDEKGCDRRSCSGIGKAVCKIDGQCIDELQICDGHADCADGADEVNCPGYCSIETQDCQECLASHENAYMCGNGSHCLSRQDVCSPYSNCPNATIADKAYCAIQHLRSIEYSDSVSMRS